MTVKEHYDTHLGNFYSWMAGDFTSKQKDFQQFLEKQKLTPTLSKIALDLGAGHGIQSVALGNLGFQVKALDFNKQLLSELQTNRQDLPIEIIEADIRSVENYEDLQPELIVCWGDTLTHLDNTTEVKEFIENCAKTLIPKGKLLLSFRDYTFELKGDKRFIPVKQDGEKILTCFLEYETERVRVTDLLYEKNGKGWEQKVSSYYKVRISPQEVEKTLVENGLTLRISQSINGLRMILAEK
ncbi:methyltransferase domain-containing protein [Rapidithrix thailandica]|uniref:Methyltransferase domain-containing protein n=1 Tax=Rapidithrix thailandica TaxID=413964 RepID=A0AAW9SAC1_9BACT